MSLLVDRLAAYLESRGEGLVGESIFKLHRPAAPLECISLHATGGYPPDRYTQRERPTVMLVVREETPDEALSKAYSLFNDLHGQQNLDLGGGIWALTIEAIGSPGYAGTESIEGGNAHLASFNIALDLRRPSTP